MRYVCLMSGSPAYLSYPNNVNRHKLIVSADVSERRIRQNYSPILARLNGRCGLFAATMCNRLLPAAGRGCCAAVCHGVAANLKSYRKCIGPCSGKELVLSIDLLSGEGIDDCRESMRKPHGTDM